MTGWTAEESEKILTRELAELCETTGWDDWTFEENRAWQSGRFTALAVAGGYRDTWVAGGSPNRTPSLVYFVGFWCGKDRDLICVEDSPLLKTAELNPLLSPGASTPETAILAADERRRELRFSWPGMMLRVYAHYGGGDVPPLLFDSKERGHVRWLMIAGAYGVVSWQPGSDSLEIICAEGTRTLWDGEKRELRLEGAVLPRPAAPADPADGIQIIMGSKGESDAA